MADDANRNDPPLRYLDVTLHLTGVENQLICAAIFRANEAGLLRDFVDVNGPGVFNSVANNIFAKIAIASAEQGDPYAQALCLQAGIPFGGGTGTAQ
ncbi:hypothetical protein [Paraburkholderia acidipaludis]|uniref:hypothetical protein n=1 Tax=Paraburkholderia acidipaludis TaxID=660537 RepID=UPI0005BBEF55|nr:hypothetical protein [Paraburkholderia acidipaludis]